MTRSVKEKVYICKGKKYSTIKQIAVDYKFDYPTLARRMNRGFTPDQALDKNFRKKYGYDKRKNSVLYNGVLYSTLSLLAQQHGISTQKLKYRLEQGYSPSKAIEVGFLTEIMYRGRIYRSKKEIAERFGVDVDVLSDRLNRGWTIGQALNVETRPKHTEIEYNGKRYSSKYELYTSTGLSYGAVDGRLRKGFSLDDALNTTLESNKVIFDGVEYETRKELANKHGISRQLLDFRLKQGYSLEEALSSDFKRISKLKESERKGILYRGVRYPTKTDLAQSVGLPLNTLVSRVRLGYTLEQALDPDFSTKYAKKRGRPTKNRGQGVEIKSRDVKSRKIEFDGVVYASRKELAEAYGIKPYNLKNRLERGWTLEKALEIEMQPRHIQLNGVSYDSFRELERVLGLGLNVLRNRLRRGYTLEEATDPTFGESMRGRRVVYDGVEYKSLSDFCRKLDLPYSRVYKLTREGKSISEAVHMIKNSKK